MALPTFFIIGAAKSGTTSLHYYLDLHDEIQMSLNKEPHFFANPENGIPFPMGRVERRSDYERLFDPKVTTRGEASPSYAAFPRRPDVPERIKQLVPEARFIYLVRDPIARSVSHYQHAVAAGNERRTLPEALADAADPYCYLTCQSFYKKQLDRYLECFPQDRILVIDQTELLSQRRDALRKAFGFLGVNPDFYSPQFEIELLKSEGRRVSTPAFTGMIKRTTSGRTKWIPTPLRRAVRGQLERRLLDPVPGVELEDKEREVLAELYADDVAGLRTLTGLGLSSWSL